MDNSLIFCKDQNVYAMDFDMVLRINTKAFQEVISNHDIFGVYIEKSNDYIRLSFCSSGNKIETKHNMDIPVFNFDTENNESLTLFMSGTMASFADSKPTGTILLKKGISKRMNILDNAYQSYFLLYISEKYPLCIKYHLSQDSYVKMCLHPFELTNLKATTVKNTTVKNTYNVHTKKKK